MTLKMDRFPSLPLHFSLLQDIHAMQDLRGLEQLFEDVGQMANGHHRLQCVDVSTTNIIL